MAEATELVKVPSGITVTLTGDGGRHVAVKGPNGELKRTLAQPGIEIRKDGDNIRVHADLPRRRTKALVGTFASHIRNMVLGAEKDFQYEMKVVYAHFPIKVKAQGAEILIDNFLGEKTPRRARIRPGVKVKVAGEQLVITGADVEEVSQTAANIEQSTKVRGFDLRVFQDGIYITAKGA